MFYKQLIMLGGLTAIATLELFTQNYFKYDRISFTMRKRIKFWVSPPGARLFRPLPLFVQRLDFFCKILDLIRIWSESDPDLIRTFFVEKMCGSDPDQIRIRSHILQKKYSLCVRRWSGLESCAPGGYIQNWILFHMVKLIRSYFK